MQLSRPLDEIPEMEMIFFLLSYIFSSQNNKKLHRFMLSTLATSASKD
jgi:hypothetical protein